MGRLFHNATIQATLFDAWRKIRSNGIKSQAIETRFAVEQFDQSANREIRRIQRQIRDDKFVFDPQKGVIKSKASGGKRGIVMASVHNRVVERALLDTMQKQLNFVKAIINQPTSIGGVPNRSVPHGLKLMHDAFNDGKTYFLRSDISGFFDHIPRKEVLKKIAKNTDDERFLKLLDDATAVTLANERELGESRSVFPTDSEGVAQGSPLSPLFGNILLHDFDLELNGRGIVCIRFIDDFLILGESESKVRATFKNAQAHLTNLGLQCHDPFSSCYNEVKAAHGKIDKGFVFLGYDCRPGLFQPSLKARQSIKKTIDDHLTHGRQAIIQVQKEADSFSHRHRYCQTLAMVDQVLRGWGEAFAYNNAASTLENLDQEIDQKLNRFRAWYAGRARNMDWKTKRRTGGVCLLSDISSKSLNELPFVVDGSGRFRVNRKTVTISTDGSVINAGGRRGKDRGPGGWAFVVHDTNEEQSGKEPDTTNNISELRAVIEAIRFVKDNVPIVIRTDSQYVNNAVNKQNLMRSNRSLWDEFSDVKRNREIGIVWVKGHNKDPHNERADALANKQAHEMNASLNACAT